MWILTFHILLHIMHQNIKRSSPANEKNAVPKYILERIPLSTASIQAEERIQVNYPYYALNKFRILSIKLYSTFWVKSNFILAHCQYNASAKYSSQILNEKSFSSMSSYEKIFHFFGHIWPQGKTINIYPCHISDIHRDIHERDKIKIEPVGDSSWSQNDFSKQTTNLLWILKKELYKNVFNIPITLSCGVM